MASRQYIILEEADAEYSSRGIPTAKLVAEHFRSSVLRLDTKLRNERDERASAGGFCNMKSMYVW